MAKVSKKKMDYINEYNRDHRTQFSISLNNLSDKTVIEKLRETPNRADYIRKLVERDIEEN